MITHKSTSLTYSKHLPQSNENTRSVAYLSRPSSSLLLDDSFDSDSKTTDTSEPEKENKIDVQCHLCIHKSQNIKNHLKCKACKRIICKVHSVTLQESRNFRICDSCEEVRLNAQGNRHVIDEQKYVKKQKIRYINEEIERKQHDINFKSLCIAKLQSIIKKSQTDWETKQLDLLDKIQREKAQNDRLETIAENLRTAVSSSHENMQYIIQADNRYNIEIDSTRDLSEVITREIFILMSEVDKFNQSLKKNVPIYKLSSFTCPNCCSEIMKNCRTQEGSFSESNGRISRNISIMEKLQEISCYDESRCGKSCKCIVI